MLNKRLGIPDPEYTAARYNARRAIRAGDVKTANAWLSIAERIVALDVRDTQNAVATSKQHALGKALHQQQADQMLLRARFPKQT